MTTSNILGQSLGWALLHFVWQGALIAISLKIVLRCLRGCSANARYLASCAALVLILAAPIATLSRLVSVSPTLVTRDGRQIASSPTNDRAGASQLNGGEQSPLPSQSASGNLLNRQDSSIFRGIEDQLNRLVPYLLVGWLIGVFTLFVRFAGGFVWTRRLKRQVEPALAEWKEMLDSLAHSLRISRPVRLCASALVEVPTVTGWLHPLILFPLKALTGLEPEQLRALLAHELAHIRRYDYLVNMLQTAVEMLLFYHPAVWWVSKQMRIEREHACDDVAVAACEVDAIIYARALLSFEETRADLRESGLVMAADGGSLPARIRRIVAPKPNRTASLSAATLSVILLTVITGASLLLLGCTRAQAVGDSSSMTKRNQAQTATPGKNYQEMTSAEQTAFIATQARNIARRMSGNEYEFTPAFEAEIRKFVDYYVKRIGNLKGDRPGKGDARFVFERGQTFAPTLIPIFKARNISPLIGLYLPLIESEYVNLETPNSMGALGMFQFLPQTGARYGLTTEDLTNVEKSADAAARYISDSLVLFRNDPMKEALAVLSYNRGRQKMVGDLQLVLDDQNRQCSICALTAARGQLDENFRSENVHYVPLFFAAAIIGENPQAFGLSLQPLSSYER
jgi:beta-lactamase regulating signal transducer with metallopeptidase domain